MRLKTSLQPLNQLTDIALDNGMKPILSLPDSAPLNYRRTNLDKAKRASHAWSRVVMAGDRAWGMIIDGGLRTVSEDVLTVVHRILTYRCVELIRSYTAVP